MLVRLTGRRFLFFFFLLDRAEEPFFCLLDLYPLLAP